MANRSRIAVTGRDGMLGWIDPTEQPAGNEDAIVRLESGQAIRVPKDLLINQPDGGYYLPVSSDQIQAAHRRAGESQEEVVVIPVIAEEIGVSKQQVTTGRVRISKHVHENEQVIDTPILREEVDVQRVPVNRQVEQAPEVRYEGDTMIIPVLEEVLVVEKRLMLKEEVRVTRKHSQVQQPQHVTLREEEVEVQRLDNNASNADAAQEVPGNDQ